MHIRLKKGREGFFDNRHLWIFSGAIDSFPDGFENGNIYPVVSFEGKKLGFAYFNKNVSLSGRVVSFGDNCPYKAIKDHLKNAFFLRRSLFSLEKTNAFRLVNGEGDFLPGLVIDYYAGYLVLQSNTLGIDLLKEEIIACLREEKEVIAIFEKSTGQSRKEEGLEDSIGVLYGEDKEQIVIMENGVLFQVDWRKGQKTGFFLDQREMRKKVGELSFSKRVLNLFSYTGGFSIYAKKGGATKVTSLDISSSATKLAEENMRLNGFNPDDETFLSLDAFTFLDEKPLDYDLVILDPPAFAKKKGDIERASKGYRQINKQALLKMPRNSFLLTCSCSYYIGDDLFLKILFQAAKLANRNVQIIGKHIQAACHPVSLFHPESHYLKSFLLRLL